MGDRYGRRDDPGRGPRGPPRGGGRLGERERSGAYPHERGGGYGGERGGGGYGGERGGGGYGGGGYGGGHRPEGRPTSGGRGGGGRDYSGEKRDSRGGMRGGPRGGGRGGGGGFGAAFSRPHNPREQVPDAGELVRLDDLPPAATPEDLGRLAYTPAHALRPGYGSAGRGVSVKANWFKAELTLDEAYQFDVDIRAIRRDGTIAPTAEEEEAAKEGQASTAAEPAPPRRGGPPPRPQRPLRAETSRLVMLELAKTLKWRPGCWAFDGRKVMYSPMSGLASAEGLRAEVEIEPDDEPGKRRYLVIIRPVSVINFSGLRSYLRAGERLEESETVTHALQCLDIVLRQRAAHTSGALVFARSIHFRGDRPQRIGEGAEVWLGYQQSLRPCLTGLALNVDQAATAVLEELPLIEFCEALAGGPLRGPLPDGVRMKLNRALRNIKISTTHTKFVKAIRHLTSTSPFEETFERDGKTVSIAEYMLAQYNIRLARRDLPCVAVGNGRILLPMELCRIAPRQRVRKPTENQTSELIRVAAQRPGDRAKHIEECVTKQVDAANDPTARAFGLRINNRMMDVQARVLPHPSLSYGSPANFDPRNQGAWNLKEVRFLNGSELPSWACVCFANPRGAAEDLESARGMHGPTFMGEFIDMLNKCGIRTPREAPPVLYPGRGESAYDSLHAAREAAAKAFGGKPAALILVVLPDTGAALYKEVKQAGDSLVGLPTQCVVAKKAGIGCPPRGRLQYCANVAMKVNAKLGGCNVRLGSGQRLPVLQSGRPFMILGADVTHPTGDEGGPSVAAVVASMDATATRYAARVSMQRGRQEIIADLKSMVKSLLLEFYRATKGLKPEAILFYRDGVAESQFREVYYKEYSALREACAEMSDTDYRPPITLVIVQKRHHTRLFPQPNDNQNRDRSGNILPGTVVDRDIAHPHDFSFFLNSHAGIQGTSKPSHYSVLVDENRFGADGMQMLTYHLCYLFCRCSRSISLCPPAMYAHLAAFRGRIMIRRGDDSETASVSSGGAGGTGIEFMSINPKLGQRMFYV